MINNLRLKQQQEQIKTLRDRRLTTRPMAATPTARSDTDGRWRLQGPDGGTLISRYNGNTVVSDTVSVSPAAAIGVPAVFTQKTR
jgi:hypothetical protein